MERRRPECGSVLLVETPEETARAIASALEFLRDEAAAVGMRDVSVLIGLAHARAQDHCTDA